jgi:hypothetical protein
MPKCRNDMNSQTKTHAMQYLYQHSNLETGDCNDINIQVYAVQVLRNLGIDGPKQLGFSIVADRE